MYSTLFCTLHFKKFYMFWISVLFSACRAASFLVAASIRLNGCATIYFSCPLLMDIKMISILRLLL